MGSKLPEAGGTSPPKPMSGVDGSMAVKPQAWMRWMLMVSGLTRRLGPVRSRSVAGCGRRKRKSALPFDEPFRYFNV